MTIKKFGTENKETVILLHGGGLSWWNYLDEIELLKNQFQVIVPILDGHSKSDHDFTSIEDNAIRIINYIDDHFNGKVKMIGGLSLGGQILLEILARRSDICNYAIIESALAIPMPITHILIEPSMKLSYGLIQKKWFSKLQFTSLKIRDNLFDNYYNDTRKITRENYIAFLKGNSAYRVSHNLSACQAKVLIFVGSQERPIMKKSARIIGDLIPNSVLVTLEGYFHGDLSINHAEEYVKRMISLMK